MAAAVVILSVISAVLLFIVFRYRRQIKSICRQLAFHKENDSNLIISVEYSSKPVVQLQKELNEVLEKHRQFRTMYVRKERSISDVYTNLSHDIRTPLTSLDGYFQLLSDCSSEEEKQRYISIIKERITSLNEMLEELFTFAKLRSSDYVLELSQTDITDVLKKTVISYYENWLSNNITPEIRIPDEHIFFNGNQQALRRTIQNIIKNVLVHGKEKIAVSLEKKESCAVITISNLVSEPEKINVDLVFERFYKADEARRNSSTGLGLSIAQEFVRKMNGSVHAELKGSVFAIVIELPV